MTENRLPKAALNYKAIGRKDIGRPRMRCVYIIISVVSVLEHKTTYLYQQTKRTKKLIIPLPVRKDRDLRIVK